MEHDQEQLALLTEYVRVKGLRDQCEAQMTEIRDRLAGMVTEKTVVQLPDGTEVVAELRRPSRKPNVQALLSAGYKMSQIGTFRPLVSAVDALAETEEWDDERIAQFFVAGTEAPTIGVRVTPPSNQEDR